jgi:hypothetical protein
MRLVMDRPGFGDSGVADVDGPDAWD